MYKAKRKDNGEWVVGHHVTTPSGEHRIYWKPCGETNNTYHAVISGSVCRSIGITDCNGNMIFLGDIIDAHQTINGYNKFVVMYDEKELRVGLRYYGLKDEYEYSVSDFFSTKLFGEVEYEVIGSIFDSNFNKLPQVNVADITIIAAVDENLGIGNKGVLPWHLKKDMEFFNKVTQNSFIVMGRKTYESIPLKNRPLKNRRTIIITKNENYKASGCIVLGSIEKFFKYLENVENTKEIFGVNDNKKCFIIGGGSLYNKLIDDDRIGSMLITHVDAIVDTDTKFPDINGSDWKIETIYNKQADDNNDYGFKISKYTRKDLNYWEENCEKDYLNTPISVLRYITELENKLDI